MFVYSKKWFIEVIGLCTRAESFIEKYYFYRKYQIPLIQRHRLSKPSYAPVFAFLFSNFTSISSLLFTYC